VEVGGSIRVLFAGRTFLMRDGDDDWVGIEKIR
jgi:hypothetical protein